MNIPKPRAKLGDVVIVKYLDATYGCRQKCCEQVSQQIVSSSYKYDNEDQWRYYSEFYIINKNDHHFLDDWIIYNLTTNEDFNPPIPDGSK